MGLFEDHVLQEGDGVDVLLLHGAVLLLLLTNDHAGGLGLEEYAAGGDGLGTTVLEFDDTDAGEAYLEDADAIELDLLAEFEEVFEGFAKFLKDGLDVGLLHRGLALDEVGELLSADEVVVVDSRGEVLAVSGALAVFVLGFNKFLRHELKVKK